MSSPPSDTPSSGLSKIERWNIGCLLIAWSCVVCSLTIVVGNSAVIVQSVDGSSSIAPFALATFFVGMSSVSLLLTHWMFTLWGRKVGFAIGVSLGVLGSLIGGVGVIKSSPATVILSMAPLGAGSGIGMYLRFASMETVPPQFQANAVTWVLLGGCLAAFVGPEAAQASTEIDWSAVQNDDSSADLKFLGVFCVTALFNILQALFISMVVFPATSTNKDSTKAQLSSSDDSGPTLGNAENTVQFDSLFVILSRSSFWLPMLVAALNWAVMAMPMGLVRVVMSDIGYSSRQSLTVMEIHFLSMYGPGLVSGTFIARYGPQMACWVSVGAYVVATAANLTARPDASKTIFVLPFYVGLIFLGVGWNFGFSAATVWVSKVYQSLSPSIQTSELSSAPGQSSRSACENGMQDEESQEKPQQPKGDTNPPVQYKSQIQAANEFGMFLLSGGSIFSTGYIYSAGGAGIDGWKTLQYVIAALIAAICALLLLDRKLQRRAQRMLSP